MRNRLTAVPFTKANFSLLVRSLVEPYGPVKRGDEGTVDGPDVSAAQAERQEHRQLVYLANYLADGGGLDCGWMLLENHYIDHEYMDAFAAYYSRCLKPYPNFCQRIHFFDRKTNESLLSGLMQKLTPGAAKESVEQLPDLASLRKSYLGFTVVRPHNQTFIGLTVLKPLDADANRCFCCTRVYSVNLMGMDFSLKGLAFQQQDGAVSACAATALWSAFHKTAFEARFRIPSPAEITNSATRFNVSGGRSFPSAGLSTTQICDAIRATDLEPELLTVADTPEICRATLHAYLSSGMPVVALMKWEKGNELHGLHAVTVVGYRNPGTASPDAPAYRLDGKNLAGLSIELRGSRIPECYVHDDRTGPYTRLFFDDTPFVNKERKELHLSRVVLDYRWGKRPRTEHAVIDKLIIPVYPKLRLKFQKVLDWSARTFDQLVKAVPELFDPPGLQLDVSFQLARSYKNDFALFDLPAADRATFLYSVSFPRYVGVARLLRQDVALLDLLFDMTESELGFPVLAMVARDKSVVKRVPELRDKELFLFPLFP